MVYAKRSFAGAAGVLAYLSRYTHRVTISNQQLVAMDERGVTFAWKDYRLKSQTRYKTLTLPADEFMRRFLMHVLPGGFHRIRHYGLIANAERRENLARARELLSVDPEPTHASDAAEETTRLSAPAFICPDCGAPMITQTFKRGELIRAPTRVQSTPRWPSSFDSQHLLGPA